MELTFLKKLMLIRQVTQRVRYLSLLVFNHMYAIDAIIIDVYER